MKENKALFEEILNQQPRLHVSASGEPISWAVSPDVLRYPFNSACGNTLSLETGCGLSTVVLCIQGGEHTAVTPFPEEVGRVEAYCRVKDIPTSRVKIHTGRSEEVLPTLPRSPWPTLAGTRSSFKGAGSIRGSSCLCITQFDRVIMEERRCRKRGSGAGALRKLLSGGTGSTTAFKRTIHSSSPPRRSSCTMRRGSSRCIPWNASRASA